MDRFALRRHYWRNLASTVLLLGVMLLVSWWAARLFFGPEVLPSLLLGLGLALALGSGLPPQLILQLRGARPLSRQQIPALFDALHVLSQRVGLEQPPQLYYLPQPELNAFATGSAKASAIGLTHGLLTRMNQAQLCAILAHELAHIRHGDMRVMFLASSATQFVATLAWLGWFLLLFNLPLQFIGAEPPPWLPLFALMLAPLPLQVLQQALSRTREYAADLEAARLLGKPQWLISALQTLERGHHGMLARLGMRVQRSWLSSHPATEQRIQRLRELAPTSPYHEILQPAQALLIPNTVLPGLARPRRIRWHF